MDQSRQISRTRRSKEVEGKQSNRLDRTAALFLSSRIHLGVLLFLGGLTDPLYQFLYYERTALHSAITLRV
ncbi:MAG: hypothetical protein AB7F89_15200, partial [Pirellulaceae bacterium]